MKLYSPLKLALVFTFSILAIVSEPAAAASDNWICSNNGRLYGFWEEKTCWDLARTPTDADTVTINTVGGALTTVGIDNNTGAAYAGSLTIDTINPAPSVTLNQSGGSLTVTGNEEVGFTGPNGNYNLSGGSNDVGGTLTIGNSPYATGSYNISGTGSLSAGEEIVALYGTGNITQSSGSNQDYGDLTLATGYDSHGTYTLSGGMLTVTGNIVGINACCF